MKLLNMIVTNSIEKSILSSQQNKNYQQAKHAVNYIHTYTLKTEQNLLYSNNQQLNRLGKLTQQIIWPLSS